MAQFTLIWKLSTKNCFRPMLLTRCLTSFFFWRNSILGEVLVKGVVVAKRETVADIIVTYGFEIILFIFYILAIFEFGLKYLCSKVIAKIDVYRFTFIHFNFAPLHIVGIYSPKKALKRLVILIIPFLEVFSKFLRSAGQVQGLFIRIYRFF